MKKKNRSKPVLTVVVISRNEEEMIEECLKSVSWAPELLVVDVGSTDRTRVLAREAKAKVVALPFRVFNFSGWRNRAMKEASGDWVVYIDADERVTPELKEEMLAITSRKPKQADPVAFAIPRRNFYFGKEMKHGGAWPDYVRRLFWKPAFKGWRGDLHEQADFKGREEKLNSPLLHYTHRDLTSMMTKTIGWTKIEAELLYEAGHPPVVWWRVIRMMLTKFWERVIIQAAWKDGTEGWLNAIFEVFNSAIIYVRLWEIQQQKKP